MADSVPSLLQDVLACRAWVQADLADVLGWPVQMLSEVSQGKRRLDAAMALDLSGVSDCTAEAWLQVQAAGELTAARAADGTPGRLEQIAARADLEAVVPMRELRKRRVVVSDDLGGQRQEVQQLLEVADLADDPPYSVSARRSTNAVPLTRLQRAWIALARNAARSAAVPAYDPGHFGDLVRSLPRTVHAPEDFKSLPSKFAGCGVRLVHVPGFPGGRIDGVSLELGGAPMIALSGRGKRLDKVLWTLLHECAHVLSDHWRGRVRIHEGGGVVGDESQEGAVDELARSWVLPVDFRAFGTVSKVRVDALASEHGLSRAVMVGQLQHRGVIPWSSLLGRGLPTVEEALLTWS